MAQRARATFKGFLPRGSESWEEWVTRNIEAFEELDRSFFPAALDILTSGYVPTPPSSHSIASCWFQEVTPIFCGLNYSGTSTSAVTYAQSAGQKVQWWVDELTVELYTVISDSPMEQFVLADSVPAVPNEFYNVCDQPGTCKVRMCLVEFYGTGVASIFDPDRNPLTEADMSDLFTRPNVFDPANIAEAMNSTVIGTTGIGYPCRDSAGDPKMNLFWYPRQMYSSWRKPLNAVGAINQLNSWSRTASHSVLGVSGRFEGDEESAGTFTNWTNVTPSPWEFDIIWEETTEYNLGPYIPQIGSGNAAGTIAGLYGAISRRTPGVYYRRLDLPIHRTINANNMDINGSPTTVGYLDRRIFLFAFADRSGALDTETLIDPVNVTTVRFNTTLPPPVVTMTMAGRLIYLQAAETVTNADDPPAMTAEALAAGDGDDVMSAGGQFMGARQARGTIRPRQIAVSAGGAGGRAGRSTEDGRPAEVNPPKRTRR